MTFWKALFIGVTLLVVVSARDQVFGQGGRWTVKAPIPTPRGGLAVGVVNGILYAVGGRVDQEYLPTVEAYDPSTNSWTTKAPMPAPRGYLSVGVVDGILYALGGFGSQGPVSTRLDAYDPVRNTWKAKAPMPTPRDWYATGVAKGILYAVGGWGPTGLVEAYDPTTNNWTAKVPMPSSRSNLGIGVVDDILYAAGGECCLPGHGSRVLATLEAYDPTTNSWTTKAPMPTPRYGFAVAVANQVLYAVGGHKGSGGDIPTTTEYATPVDVVEAYDPIRNVWTTKTHLPGNRNLVGLGSVNGILYAAGGFRCAPYVTSSPLPHGPIECTLDPITYALKAP
jgi:N-acetylneuraminic acid mutarotase